VPADRVVSAVRSRRAKPKPPREPSTPRVVEFLRKAIEWQTLLESGKAVHQADITRQKGITRGLVTQVMGLLRLAPEIQQHIQSIPAPPPPAPCHEMTASPNRIDLQLPRSATGVS
jgi:hypothetical protein